MPIKLLISVLTRSKLNFLMFDVALMVIVRHGGGTHLRGLEKLRIAIDVGSYSLFSWACLTDV